MTTLFDPIQLGGIACPNRIILAPLTRCRASAGRLPNDLMRDYYVQRAGAGLILTEATSISPMGVGYPDTPGIWSDAQMFGWKNVVDSVHAAGGRIVSQLWHVGRISDPVYLDGKLPVAPSAIAADGHPSLVRPKHPFVTPRALEADEIGGIIADYRRAAENAKRAGFDGVELHGANGYLLDQFLQDGSNHRIDEFGGPIENRAKVMIAAVDACIEVFGAGRVGLHLAPKGGAHGIQDSNPAATFSYVGHAMRQRGIAFICSRETLEEPFYGAQIREAFGGPYIINQELTKETGTAALAAHKGDAVAFGRLFIANPDLPERFRYDAELNVPNPDTFYSSGPEGYVDYPALSDFELSINNCCTK